MQIRTQEELVASWMSQMTVAELRSLRPESVRGPSLNLLDVELAKEQTIEHAFAHVSVKRDRHVEALLLRRGLGRVLFRSEEVSFFGRTLYPPESNRQAHHDIGGGGSRAGKHRGGNGRARHVSGARRRESLENPEPADIR